MVVDIGSLTATNIGSPLSGWRCGAEIAPIVIAKFTRLEVEAAIAKNNETEAHAMAADALHTERVAKRSAEKVRVDNVWPMLEHINSRML
ncbi:hypothetical protein ACB092_06G284400 [Castanea dentata]